MKAIYFKLKESSLSWAASNREGDKDGAPRCRPFYVVNVMREKEEEGVGEGGRRKKKGAELERRRWQKSGGRHIKQAR